MLIRPGSKPGPAWMRQASDALVDPERSRKIMMPFWVFFILYMIAFIGIIHLVTAVALAKEYGYESRVQIAGLPIVSYHPVARGIIALGGRATGFIAIGGVAVGLFALGGVAIGAIAIGGCSLGVFALAAIAIGWRALGRCAFGEGALGGLAVGKYAYAGKGVAYGSREAGGRQKETLLG
jgi:hypothetical protein